ncbi:MAG: hypothetical protein Q9209_002996 [Squamulea sp. 1 TL-2023]
MAPNTDASKGSISADAYSKVPSPSSGPSSGLTELHTRAEHMLCIIVAHSPSGFLRPTIQSKIDQTAILAQSMLMLRSSVLNASMQHRGQQQSSLMPLLARQFPKNQGIEAVIRPRLPPVLQDTDAQILDVSLDVENKEKTDEQRAWRSRTEFDFSQETPYPTDMKIEKQEQTTLSSDLPPIKSLPIEAEPATDPRLEPEEQAVKSSIPAKRSLDLDPDSMNGISLDKPEDELASGAEPANKRLREGAIYVAPVKGDDLPPSTVIDPVKESNPHSTKLSTHFGLLANPRTINQDVDDEDSDDSSIPPMDLTLATDDEEEDDEE